jgi:hypothetical protein
VLIQTSRPAYVALFEIVPGRGVSVVYPQPMRVRDQMLTGLNWVPVYWTMKPRFVSNDTRYIYAVASDTPLLLSDEDYDARHIERALGSTYYSSNPNATVRAIARQYVRSQPDEWWGEDMYTVPLRDGRMDLIVRLARVYCPGGIYFDVREDMTDRIWCPARRARPGERPVASEPDSVFNSGGRRVPRHVNPTQRTPIFRVPAATDVGQQQGHPTSQPERPRGYPHTQPQPQNPTIPTQNQPQPPAQNPPQTQTPQQQPPQQQPPQQQPPQQQPPQQQPPQAQPPQNQPPQGQPAQPAPTDTNATVGKGNNGRRAHGDPQNADPRGNGNGYGNGGRSTQSPAQTPPTTPTSSNPQPQQQGQGQQGQGQSQGHGNGNQAAANGNAGNNGNSGSNGNGANTANNGNNAASNANNGNNGNGHGKSPNEAKPGHDNATPNAAAILKGRLPGQKKQDDKKQDDKKASNDSTDAKKKP